MFLKAINLCCKQWWRMRNSKNGEVHMYVPRWLVPNKQCVVSSFLICHFVYACTDVLCNGECQWLEKVELKLEILLQNWIGKALIFDLNYSSTNF